MTEHAPADNGLRGAWRVNGTSGRFMPAIAILSGAACPPCPLEPQSSGT